MERDDVSKIFERVFNIQMSTYFDMLFSKTFGVSIVLHLHRPIILRGYIVCTYIVWLFHKLYVFRIGVLSTQLYVMQLSLCFVYAFYGYNAFYKDSYIFALYLNALKCDIMNLYPVEVEEWSRYRLLWLVGGCIWAPSQYKDRLICVWRFTC